MRRVLLLALSFGVAEGSPDGILGEEWRVEGRSYRYRYRYSWRPSPLQISADPGVDRLETPGLLGGLRCQSSSCFARLVPSSR